MESEIPQLTQKQIAEVERKLKAKSFVNIWGAECGFGITKLLSLAGYVLTDGTFIDFSTGLQPKPYRDFKHNAVSSVFPPEIYGIFSTDDVKRAYFMEQTGAVRISYINTEKIFLEWVNKKPTEEQLQHIYQSIKLDEIKIIGIEYTTVTWSTTTAMTWEFKAKQVYGEMEMSVFRRPIQFINWVNSVTGGDSTGRRRWIT